MAVRGRTSPYGVCGSRILTTNTTHRRSLARRSVLRNTVRMALRTVSRTISAASLEPNREALQTGLRLDPRSDSKGSPGQDEWIFRNEFLISDSWAAQTSTSDVSSELIFRYSDANYQPAPRFCDALATTFSQWPPLAPVSATSIVLLSYAQTPIANPSTAASPPN